MDPREYVVAVVRRWWWAATAGLLCAVVGAALALTTTPVYRSTESVFVGAEQVAGLYELGTGSLTGEDLVPSLGALARSAAVLQPVIDELQLPGGVAGLAADVQVGVVPGRGSEDTSVMTISVLAGSPELAARTASAVTRWTRTVAGQLYPSPDGGSLVTIATITPARVPRFAVTTATRTGAALGLLVGGGLAVLAAGTAERARPRVRGAVDVARLTRHPVLAELPPARRRPRRPAPGPDVDRLRHLVGCRVPTGARRVLLVAAEPQLAGDLAEHLGGDLPVVPVGSAGELARVRAGDALLLVADAGRTTRRQLAGVTAAADASGAPVLGVVLTAVPRVESGLPARLWTLLRWGGTWAQAAPAAAGAHPARSTQLLAGAAVVACGFPELLAKGSTPGLAVSVVLLPLWIGALRRYRSARSLLGLAGLALVAGLLLARWSSVDHGTDDREALATALFVLAGLGTIGVVLWAREVLSVRAIGVCYGSGLLLHGVLHAAGSLNVYKFELSTPITIIVLALCVGRRGPLAPTLALGALGLAAITNDARSAFAFCLAAAALSLWQSRAPASGQRPHWAQTVALLAALGVGGYYALSELLVSGALGEEVQLRSTTQIEQSGSLLLGGRPEWIGTLALMRAHPWGFGLGTVPGPTEVQLVERAIGTLNIPTAEGYIRNYMLAGRFELHSIVADLWSNLGPLGLATGLAMAGLLVRQLAELLSARQADPLVSFLCLSGVWALAFAPLPADLPVVVLALGLALSPRRVTVARPTELHPPDETVPVGSTAAVPVPK